MADISKQLRFQMHHRLSYWFMWAVCNINNAAIDSVHKLHKKMIQALHGRRRIYWATHLYITRQVRFERKIISVCDVFEI